MLDFQKVFLLGFLPRFGARKVGWERRLLWNFCFCLSAKLRFAFKMKTNLRKCLSFCFSRGVKK